MSKAYEEFESLVFWLRDHKGDVNHSAFAAACSRVARLVSQEYNIRYLDCIKNSGYIELDYASTLLRTYIPSDVMFHNLPGYSSLLKKELEYENDRNFQH